MCGEHTQNEEEKKYSALIQFTEITNNAFDILNIRYRSEKTKTWNKWKLPLTTTGDWRFEVVKKPFYDHNRVFKLPAYIM